MAKKDNEQLEAQKKLKAAEKSAPKKEEKAKGEKKKRRRGWFKRFRGETKKITWPDAKTVVKSTGIVIVTIFVVGSMVWVIDWVLGFALGHTLQFAAGRELGQHEEVIDLPPNDAIGQVIDAEPEQTTEADTNDDADANDEYADANDDTNDEYTDENDDTTNDEE
ncbi:MAG: preprotein translocase subunit SecE [Oscillospiraceae bacterium]|nr:preprotein translocase subunit SecE [Oscillospiraceae bacterium]